MATVKTVKGDTAPWIFTLLENGVALTSAQMAEFDSATIDVRHALDKTMKVTDGVVTVHSAANAQVKFSPAGGDVDTAGEYQCKITVTWNDTTTSTFPSEGHDLAFIADTLS